MILLGVSNIIPFDKMAIIVSDKFTLIVVKRERERESITDRT